MKQLLFLLLFLFSLSIMNAQITINVPGDYPTIQGAINAANNGDMVLVADGTYIENIDFKGKAITVASHFIQDRDTSHITNTIIDGSQPSHPDSGSVVLFKSGEDTTSVLKGFTIKNGTGIASPNPGNGGGGGIAVFQSGALICNNIIENNSISFSNAFGGGIVVAYNSDCTTIIRNNIIRNNSVIATSNTTGGGVAVNYSGLTYIQNNIISNNSVEGSNSLGGGISIGFMNELTHIQSNKVINNQAIGPSAGGGGINIEYSGSPISLRNNLIAENSALQGGGILVESQGERDSQGMKNFNFENYTIDENKIKGNSIFLFKKMLEGVVIENNTVVNNSATSYYGGILCIDTLSIIRNSIIWGNYGTGNQIYSTGIVEYSNVEGGYSGSGNINENPEFIDSTYFCLSGTSQCIDNGDPDPLYNDVEHIFSPGYAMPPAHNTLRNDMGHSGGPNSLWCHWKWPTTIDLPSIPVLVPVDTTFTTEVVFSWSQCQPFVTRYWFEIDKSNQFITSFIDSSVTDTTYLYSGLEYGNYYWWRVKAFNATGWGEFSDVGSIVVVSVEDDNLLPIEFSLEQNYPNPFNPVTTINYSIKERSPVQLVLYDILGRVVEVLVDEEKDAGYYKIDLNAENLASGIYFYKLKALPTGRQAGDFIQTKKMVLLR